MIRLLLKIVFFPVTLLLWVARSVLRLVCSLAGLVVLFYILRFVFA